MPRYRARFVKPNGRRSSVDIDAVDMDGAVRHVEEVCLGHVVGVERLAESRRGWERARIPSGALLSSLDALELMLASGVRINAAVRSLSGSVPPGRARAFWTRVASRIEDTGSFTEAIRPFARVFPAPVLGVIAAHEASGHLAEGIGHARSYLRQMQEIRRQSLRGAAYPAVVFLAGLAASAVMCFFTLPRFSAMLADIGVARPNGLTRFFLGLSRRVVGHPLGSLLALLSPAVALAAALHPRFKRRRDRLVLAVPLVRGAVEALAMARICLTYRALSRSGIRVVDALEFCAAAAGNAVYADGIGRVVASVRGNATVGAGFERAGVFAPEVVIAVRSGESALAEVFGRLADFYAGEARHRVMVALGMIEPVMLVVVLLWVLGVTLAVVLPIAEVIGEIH